MLYRLPTPRNLSTPERLNAFMAWVWEYPDPTTYERWHNATKTATAFGWVPVAPTEWDGPATVWERDGQRVVIADDGASIR
jgi:hypothetical protein